MWILNFPVKNRLVCISRKIYIERNVVCAFLLDYVEDDDDDYNDDDKVFALNAVMQIS